MTLHVGAGTFLPVKVEDVSEHRMHAEWGEVRPKAADEINGTRAMGGRIIPVGTTALRLIETAADENGMVRAFEGDTDIFIFPGYRWRVTDALMTNFHLPRSTLFMLVAAFSGLEPMLAAYRHAVTAGPRRREPSAEHRRPAEPHLLWQRLHHRANAEPRQQL
ncbi:MAG: S-adenosylmethionine:tRNA ribosyltransferase-isomerase [Anaerolineae bacterium]|nr:S-adenosylmethionine:tRNA ribosyltransferase-isomerase [Anaerolineae bacterium]